MKRIESGSADRLCYEEAPGGSGLGQVLMGLFAGAIGVALVRARYPDDQLGTAIAVGLGSLLVLMGLVRMARRSGLEIDRKKGTVEAWEGSVIPVRRSCRIVDYSGVEVSARMIRGYHDYEHFYPIALVGLGLRKELVAPRDLAGSRRTAEEIALFLGFDLIDATSGEARHYRAAEVGLPMGERLKAEGQTTATDAAPPAVQPAPTTCPVRSATTPPVVLPEPPDQCRLAFAYKDGRLVVEVPAPRWRFVLWLPAVMFMITAAVGALLGFGILILINRTEHRLLTWNGHYLPATCITLGLGTFGLLLGLLCELPGKWIRTTIEVDRHGVCVRHRGLLFRGKQTANAAEIREVRVDAVVTRDRLVFYRLGDVRPEERKWLRDTIQLVLASWESR